MGTMIPIKATLQIGPIQTLPQNLLPITHTLRFAQAQTANPRRTLTISCSKDAESPSDELLAAALGLEIKKLNSEIAQREDAFNKSRELLVAEVSDFLGLKSEELEKKWRKMNEGEKWVLVKGFVAEWSAHYHPLSARSVKELVEEYVGGRDEFSESVSGNLLPHFRKLFGFNGDNSKV